MIYHNGSPIKFWDEKNENRFGIPEKFHFQQRSRLILAESLLFEIPSSLSFENNTQPKGKEWPSYSLYKDQFFYLLDSATQHCSILKIFPVSSTVKAPSRESRRCSTLFSEQKNLNSRNGKDEGVNGAQHSTSLTFLLFRACFQKSKQRQVLRCSSLFLKKRA